MIDIEDMVMGVGALAIIYLPLYAAYHYVNKNYYNLFNHSKLEETVEDRNGIEQTTG